MAYALTTGPNQSPAFPDLSMTRRSIFRLASPGRAMMLACGLGLAAVAAAPALAPAQTQKKPPAAQTAPKPAAGPPAQPGPQTLPAAKHVRSFDAWTSVERAQASNKHRVMLAR